MSFGLILFLLCFAVGVVLFLVYGVVIFNAMKETRFQVEKSASNIDVLLKQRFDEVPRLVEVCKAYLKHEAGILEKLTTLRSRFEVEKTGSSLVAMDDLDRALSLSVGTLNEVVEAYPQLKSSEQFLYIQKRLSELEDQIADRREYYNQAVALYQTRLDSFPDMWLAAMFRFPRMAFLKLEA